jgi:release factor glutamine methyltransferase
MRPPVRQFDEARAGDALSRAGEQLREAEVRDPRLKAEMLLASLLGCRRLELPLHRDTRLSEEQAERMESGLARLLAHEPIQYVEGCAGFMGHDFLCDARALIPRPETEMLVTAALDHAPLWARPRPVVADVGAGSGCIGLSIALARPAARVVATEVSEPALCLARENARALGVDGRVEFRQGDLLAGIPENTLDALLSNPPYIPTAEWAALPREVGGFEPRQALDGGGDGLAVYRRLVPEAATALRTGGLLWLEIGDGQGAPVRSLLEGAGFSCVMIHHDGSERERMASGVKA